jgi:hypothetical protein
VPDLGVFLAGAIVGLVVGLLLGRIRSTGALATSGTVEPGSGRRGFNLTRAVVQREVETRLDPNGLTVVADGQTYHRLEDIPHAGLREQVRKNLVNLRESVSDPETRARIDEELRAVGIDDGGAAS